MPRSYTMSRADRSFPDLSDRDAAEGAVAVRPVARAEATGACAGHLPAPRRGHDPELARDAHGRQGLVGPARVPHRRWRRHVPVLDESGFRVDDALDGFPALRGQDLVG